MYKRILIPLDGSSFSEAVRAHAQALAQALGAELSLLHVPVNPVVEFSFSDPANASSIIQKDEEEASKYIKSICAKLEKAGFSAGWCRSSACR